MQVSSSTVLMDSWTKTEILCPWTCMILLSSALSLYSKSLFRYELCVNSKSPFVSGLFDVIDQPQSPSAAATVRKGTKASVVAQFKVFILFLLFYFIHLILFLGSIKRANELT